MILFFLVVGSYLLGAVPFGVIIARWKGVDILAQGSGNPGATNVGRVLGRPYGILVFLLDMAKGLVPALAGRALVPGPVGVLDAQTVWFGLGIAAVLGHSRSPFLGFRGGKGVSTALGAGVGSAPIPALAAFALFGVVLAIFRYMSVASVVGVSAALLFGVLLPGQSPQLIPLYALLAGYVAWSHRANFARLRAGTEPRIGSRAKAGP